MATHDAASFSKKIALFVDNTFAKSDKVYQGSLFILWEAITVGNQYGPGTPVVSGYTRNSWWPSVGGAGAAPTAGPPPAKDQTLPDTTQAAAVSLLGAKMGETVVFSNGVVWITRLEFEGYSKQRPQGWVRLAAAQWQAIVEATAARLAGQSGGGAPSGVTA